MTVATLYKVYVIWTFCCTEKAFMKVYQWFYWGPKASLVPALQNFSWRPC